MSYGAIVFKAMIASPGDVNAERGVVREILADWNVIHSERRAAVLLPIGWETHSAPEMGGTAQSIINKRVLEDCDLLIGIFWTRVGTATENYASGTVEEIERHIAAHKPTMLYFSSAPVMMDSVDLDQYTRLKTFRESCKSRGLLESYSDLQDFRQKFNRQIQLKMNEEPYLAGTQQPALDAALTAPTNPVVTISPEAQELLRHACVSNGQIMLLRFIGGQHLQAGGREFIEDRNARSAAIWESALAELENEGLIKDVGFKRELFKVTREGYEFYDARLR